MKIFFYSKCFFFLLLAFFSVSGKEPEVESKAANYDSKWMERCLDMGFASDFMTFDADKVM